MRKTHIHTTKLQSEELAKSLNPLERKVYYALVGNNTSYRTQSMIAKQYGMAKSTVSDIVRRLLDARAIRKRHGDKRLVLYEKGINHAIVDEYVKLDLNQGLYALSINDLVVTTSGCPNFIHFMRTHLSGGWIDVNVVQEGILNRFNTDSTTITLFGNKELKSGRKGILAINEKTYIDGAWTSIRYQKGIHTPYKQFGIAPAHLMLSLDTLEQNKGTILELFMGKITPFFNCLERYGGWIFEKNAQGQYQFRSKAKPEYGFDGDITAVLVSLLQGNEGVVGHDALFVDHSDPAVAGAEAETRDLSVVSSILRMPETIQKQDKLSHSVDDLEGRVAILEQKYQEMDEKITKKPSEVKV